MRKIYMLLMSAFICTAATAQTDDCNSLFPDNEGAILINKRYDAKDMLLNTITYRVLKSTDNITGKEIDIEFVITDSKDQVIDDGKIIARCDNGTFYMNMTNAVLSDDVVSFLGQDTELVGDFLDYPDSFNSDPLNDNDDFEMDGGQFSVRDKNNKNLMIRTEVEDRQYLKDEKVTTPAGVFDASKITFEIKTTQGKKETTYKATEWYAPNAGIIRSETYDDKGNLLNYTVLTTLKNNN